MSEYRRKKNLNFYACLIKDKQKILNIKNVFLGKSIGDEKVIASEKKTLTFKFDGLEDNCIKFRIGIAKGYWTVPGLRNIRTKEIADNPRKAEEAEEVDRFYILDTKRGILLKSTDTQITNDKIISIISEYSGIDGIKISSWLDGSKIHDYRATSMKITVDGTSNIFSKSKYKELHSLDFLDLNSMEFNEMKLELAGIVNKKREYFAELYETNKDSLRRITVEYIDENATTYTEDFVNKSFSKSVSISVNVDDRGMPLTNEVYRRLLEQLLILNGE